MKTPIIGFIGAGNMASSLIGGLITDGWSPDCIRAADTDSARREAIRSQFAIHSSEDNISVAMEADVLVLAIKPQALHQVATELSNTVQQQKPLVISIAAGVREPDINRWLGGNIAIVRSMPNTPAMVQSGATAMIANAAVTEEQRELAETILRAVGLTLWLEDESQLDAVTALSGSGPAYFFLVMEAMEHAGRELGLPGETARLLTLQTAFGAAKMALESTDNAAILRERVTSPGGTTEKALEVFENGKFRELFDQALKAACERSREMAELIGKNT
ncbi:MAG: pyrroline-5-carboxylate reductase [Gammaproteobacteria bacterium]|nr:pyrroline-5-carboxylate reductase [Gammaproteobacteria bacterium]